MKSILQYPFCIYSDGHKLKNPNKVSIGVLVGDNVNNTIDEYYDVVEVKLHNTLMAEATAFFQAIKQIPNYCNGTYCKKYGRTGDCVSILSDYEHLIDLMQSTKGFQKSIRDVKTRFAMDEIEILEGMISEVQDITNDYKVRAIKVPSKKNIAHPLCRKAENIFKNNGKKRN